MYSVSDEAFTMLILENNIDDVFNLMLKKEEIKTQMEKDDDPEVYEVLYPYKSHGKVRYTKAVKDSKAHVTKKRKVGGNEEETLTNYQGWTAQGVKRYNELYNAVKK